MLIEIDHFNPILDRIIYEVRFLDWSVYYLVTNVIVDNAYDCVSDDYGYHLFLDYIVNIYSTIDAISKEVGFFTITSNNRRSLITTKE